MKILLRFVAAFFFIMLFSSQSQAVCTVSATGINFGAYDVFNALDTDSTGTVTITCDDSPPVTATIEIGVSPISGGFNPRQMQHVSLADLLNYNLYTKNNRNTIWGDGTGGSSSVTKKAGNSNPTTLTYYGSIPATQNVSVGVYGDTLMVTVSP